MGRLDGKVAVVTGASGVLGTVMADALRKEGARTVLLSRRQKAQETDDVIGIGADVMDRKALEAVREKVLKKWGKIDVLVNAAGGNDPRGTTSLEQLTSVASPADSFLGMDLQGFAVVHALNFTGTVLPTQVFGSAMTRRGGSVINISSMAATQPLTRVAAYGAAKAAVDNFTRWAAVHLAPVGVRVNALAPGFFLTEQNRFLLLEKDGSTPTPRGQKVLAKTPMRRYGDPKDLRGALLFLASEESSFVTGIVLPVDGGFSAHSGV